MSRIGIILWWILFCISINCINANLIKDPFIAFQSMIILDSLSVMLFLWFIKMIENTDKK